MIAALGLALVLAADSSASGPAVTPSGRPDLAAPGPGSHAPVPADTAVRVPGAPLRLGWPHERTSVIGSFAITASAPDHETREGDVRWFGYPARASLTFRAGRLSAARLTATAPSPRFGGYVPDELRRLGYRRVGAELASGTSVTWWEGPATIQLTVASGSVVAEVSARATPEPAAAPVATGETLVDFTAPDADSGALPRRISTPADAVRPALAVDAGVFGRVLVRAVVGTDGIVEHAEIERGIPELDQAALGWASDVRFEPWLEGGRPVRFRILIPVAFLPVRPSGGGARP